MILASEGEAIFAVVNFKEEGPTKEQKDKKVFENLFKITRRHVQTPLHPSSHYTIGTLRIEAKIIIVLFLF